MSKMTLQESWNFWLPAFDFDPDYFKLCQEQYDNLTEELTWDFINFNEHVKQIMSEQLVYAVEVPMHTESYATPYGTVRYDVGHPAYYDSSKFSVDIVTTLEEYTEMFVKSHRRLNHRLADRFAKFVTNLHPEEPDIQ